jgi:hypothetical protein
MVRIPAGLDPTAGTIAGSVRVEPLTGSVIASAAKQSRPIERSAARDCFVAQSALAMTACQFGRNLLWI